MQDVDATVDEAHQRLVAHLVDGRALHLVAMDIGQRPVELGDARVSADLERHHGRVGLQRVERRVVGQQRDEVADARLHPRACGRVPAGPGGADDERHQNLRRLAPGARPRLGGGVDTEADRGLGLGLGAAEGRLGRRSGRRRGKPHLEHPPARTVDPPDRGQARP